MPKPKSSQRMIISNKVKRRYLPGDYMPTINKDKTVFNWLTRKPKRKKLIEISKEKQAEIARQLRGER